MALNPMQKNTNELRERPQEVMLYKPPSSAHPGQGIGFQGVKTLCFSEKQWGSSLDWKDGRDLHADGFYPFSSRHAGCLLPGFEKSPSCKHCLFCPSHGQLSRVSCSSSSFPHVLPLAESKAKHLERTKWREIETLVEGFSKCICLLFTLPIIPITFDPYFLPGHSFFFFFFCLQKKKGGIKRTKQW